MNERFLPEYPGHKLSDFQTRSVLMSILQKWGGILPTIDRYAGRSFCTPMNRLGLAKSMLRPDWRINPDNGMVIGSDEWWGCCTTPIVTGAIDKNTGETPFREGETHVLTTDYRVVSLQELIEEDPAIVIGRRHEDFTRRTFGKPTWGIVTKKFDNLNPIPYHWHWSKWEVYDINEWDNPGVHPSHYYTTAMGLYSWVTPDDFLRSMRRFGEDGGNGVRELAPHVFMPVGKAGFCMPNGVGHSPTGLCTHETHVLMDEHFLAESLTLDGEIPASVAFLACREKDYPRSKHGDWEYLVSRMNFPANQDPDFVNKYSRPHIEAPQYCSDCVDAKWIVYGLFDGEQRCSVLRLTLQPKAKTQLRFDSPAFFHVNNGSGTVGGLHVYRAMDIEMGKIHHQSGFITQAAINNDYVHFENRGSEPFVLTLDFPQGAHTTLPGLTQ